MEFGEKFVTLNGRRLTARTVGEGAPVVLFHSLLAGSFSFEPLAERLASTHAVYLVDLPGFGSSSAVLEDLEGIAKHMAACIPELVGQDSAAIIGNGYGGFLALATAIHSPGL